MQEKLLNILWEIFILKKSKGNLLIDQIISIVFDGKAINS